MKIPFSYENLINYYQTIADSHNHYRCRLNSYAYRKTVRILSNIPTATTKCLFRILHVRLVKRDKVRRVSN